MLTACRTNGRPRADVLQSRFTAVWLRFSRLLDATAKSTRWRSAGRSSVVRIVAPLKVDRSHGTPRLRGGDVCGGPIRGRYRSELCPALRCLARHVGQAPDATRFRGNARRTEWGRSDATFASRRFRSDSRALCRLKRFDLRQRVRDPIPSHLEIERRLRVDPVRLARPGRDRRAPLTATAPRRTPTPGSPAPADTRPDRTQPDSTPRPRPPTAAESSTAT